MQDVNNLKALGLFGVALSAKIDADSTLHAVGGEYPKVIAALFAKAVPRIHTVVFAQNQDLSAFDLVPHGHPNFFRERQPERDFVVITAESLAEAIEFVHLRQEQIKAGDLSGNLPRQNHDFVGRERFYEHLEQWIRTITSGYLVLEGGVGIGKTALLAEYVHRLIARGEMPVRHFIGYHPDATGKPEAIAESLYRQLRIKYAILEVGDWQGLTAEDRLQRLLRERVSPQLDGQKEVLFIDAADQADVSTTQFLLPGAFRDLPSGVLCVITSRHQLAWIGTRENVTLWEWGKTWGDESARWDREDIGRYLIRQDQQHALSLRHDFIEEIVGQPRPPVFYTVRKNANHLREPTPAGTDPDELRSDVAPWLLPAEESIDRMLMRAEVEAVRRGIAEHDFWECLGLLAVAGEPLSPEQLEGLRVWQPGTSAKVLALTADIFAARPRLPAPRQPYEFDHPGCVRQIADHLTTSDRKRCHSRLASGCESWQSLDGSTRDYALQHRLAHWLAARDWVRFAEVFADAEFIVERSRRFDFADVYADASRAAQDDSAPRDWKAAFAEWERFLRWRIERLRYFPTAYAQEVRNEFLPEARAPFTGRLNRLDEIDSWASPLGLRKVLGPPALGATGHTDSVNSVAFSPDGQLVASGSGDRAVKVWEAATGRLIANCTGHTASVDSVAFSPDGHRVASGDQGRVRVWEAATGRLIADCTGPIFWVSSMAFSLDGHRVASGASEGLVRVWEAATGRLIADCTGGRSRVSSVAFSPDGHQVALGMNASELNVCMVLGGLLTVREAVTGRLIANCTGHMVSVNCMAFSTDGRRLASGSADGTVKVWKAATGRLIADCTGGRSMVSGVAFSPDGKLVASGSSDRAVRLWQASTGRLIADCTGHTASVVSVAFSPDGHRVASGASDGRVCMWEAATGRLIADCTGHTASVNSVAFSPDGHRLASGSGDRAAKVWEAATGRLIANCTGHTASVNSVAFSPDGQLVASASDDGTVKIWDLRRFTGQAAPCASTLFYERALMAVTFAVRRGVARLLVGDKRGRSFGYEVVSR
jgi:WD40 repeat protein